VHVLVFILKEKVENVSKLYQAATYVNLQHTSYNNSYSSSVSLLGVRSIVALHGISTSLYQPSEVILAENRVSDFLKDNS